jgi:hypothetical protein
LHNSGASFAQHSEEADQAMGTRHTLRRLPHWSDLRTLSNTSAIRSVILIPIFGYWIILNNHIATSVAQFAGPLEIGNNVSSPSWRLFATYFGLCCLAAGSLIYQIFCPRIVKEYPDAIAYTRSVTRDISGIAMDRLTVFLHGVPSLREAIEYHSERYKKSLALDHGGLVEASARENALNDYKRNLLQEAYDFGDDKFFAARVAALIFYLLGFGVLAFPALDIFWRVTMVLARALL